MGSYRNWKVQEKQNPSLSRDVQKYATWLRKQDENKSRIGKDQERYIYRESADCDLQINGKYTRIYAPFRPTLSAVSTITRNQGITLCTLLALWLLSLFLFHLVALVVLFGALIVLYFLHLVWSVVLVVRKRNSFSYFFSEELLRALDEAEWPMYTVLCPLYKETAVVPQFVEALQKLEYPKDRLQVLFLVEEEDKETERALRKMELPGFCAVVRVPDGFPRTKPRACNYGLMYASGDYCVIYDAEDIPDPWQLKRAVLAFASSAPEVACVQARLSFYNTHQNLLTRLFSIEYALWFDLVLPALSDHGYSPPLGGTSNHFRTSILRALGGWDAFNVTEDADLGMRLAGENLSAVMLDSETFEEANADLGNWIRQRSRWIKGYAQTYLVQMRNPLKLLQTKKQRAFTISQLMIGGSVVTFLVNPLMWVLFLLYVIERPWVEDVYHTLFPPLILYLGLLCLIAGNFFWVYAAMTSCMRRERYELVPFCLLMPLYWLFFSVAAAKAFFQLVRNPHYWEKTEHGLHLKNKEARETIEKLASGKFPSVELETVIRIPAVRPSEEKQKSLQESLDGMETIPAPIFPKRKKKGSKPRDIWLFATMGIAVVASISATTYYFFQHQILLYGDAHSHLTLARRFFDSTSPYDITQLGTVWLPLPHILMFTFVWIDPLWRTGLAGAFVSMVGYILATYFLFKGAYRLIGNGPSCFVGCLVFLLNPNILYLQSTPLTEMTCAATFTASWYFLLAWAQEQKKSYLLYAAFATFLATLSRYDGWPFVPVSLLVIPLVGKFIYRQKWKNINANLCFYGLLGSFGIILWFIYNKAIFGDGLAFQRGPYSAQQQQLGFLKLGSLLTYHNLPFSIKVYSLDVFGTFGILICTLSIIGLFSGIIFYIKKNERKNFFPYLVLLTPFLFYIASLYTGQSIIYTPGAIPTGVSSTSLFNVRYGIELGVPFSIWVGFLCSRISCTRFYLDKFVKIVCIFLILLQMQVIYHTKILSYQEGLNGIDCYHAIPFAPKHLARGYFNPDVSHFLALYYTSGWILEDHYTSGVDAIDIPSLTLSHEIYEGSNDLWKQALVHPEIATWIVVVPSNPNDVIAQKINIQSQSFRNMFDLVVEDGGEMLFHKHTIPLPPPHQLSGYYQDDYVQCKN